MKNKQFYLVSLLGILALAVVTSSVEAHGIQTEVVSAQKVHFAYDDGSPLKEAAVTVKDSTGKEIGTGKTDATGHFDFSSFPGVKTIEATDLMGHHGTCSTDAKGTSVHADHDHGEHSHADHDHGGHSHADHDHATPSHELDGQQRFNRSTIIIAVLIILAVIAAGFSFGRKKGCNGENE